MAMRKTEYETVDNSNMVNVYTDKFQMYIDMFMEEYRVEKIDSQSVWNACIEYLHKHIFKPDTNQRDNRSCVIDYYDINSITEVYKTYVLYCNVYKRMITVKGFCRLLGMSEDTFYRYASGNDKLSLQWSELVKKIDSDKHETLDNKLYDSNNVTGQAILVNHYYGYNLPGVSKERSQDIKPLGASQLPKLSLADGHNTMIESKD